MYLTLLAMELFKTLSFLGGYFTKQAVTRVQYTWVVFYLLCIGGYFAELPTIGRPCADVIATVNNANSSGLYLADLFSLPAPFW